MDTQQVTPMRRVLGASMIFAPALILCSSIAYALGGGTNNDELGGLLRVYGCAVLALAIVGLSLHISAFPRAAALAVIVDLGILVVLTPIGLATIRGGDPNERDLADVMPTANG